MLPNLLKRSQETLPAKSVAVSVVTGLFSSLGLFALNPSVEGAKRTSASSTKRALLSSHCYLDPQLSFPSSNISWVVYARYVVPRINGESFKDLGYSVCYKDYRPFMS